MLQDLTVCSRVRVEDMGHKMGCNGVDNGKLWFNGMFSAYGKAPCLHVQSVAYLADTMLEVLCQLVASLL